MQNMHKDTIIGHKRKVPEMLETQNNEEATKKRKTTN
jgi:hypothetical protein